MTPDTCVGVVAAGASTTALRVEVATFFTAASRAGSDATTGLAGFGLVFDVFVTFVTFAAGALVVRVVFFDFVAIVLLGS
ncbi:hypothetical protein [Aliiroseovarius sp. xm-m-378]|uniref:hypothetical protein n=1 Tax=unclassified Aliiroseovarius TaxID=2623558 RepID=UPI001568AFAC